MPKLTFWDDLAFQYDNKMLDFEKFAGEAEPHLWKRTVREYVITAVFFSAGLAALLYSNVVLGVGLLLLAVHYNQQANKSHMLLVLTAYHRAIARLLNRQATASASLED